MYSKFILFGVSVLIAFLYSLAKPQTVVVTKPEKSVTLVINRFIK